MVVPVLMSVVCSNYWQLLSHRAAGKVMTNAHWTRQFIRTHPEYRYEYISIFSRNKNTMATPNIFFF